MPNRTALVRYVYGTLSLTVALIMAMFLFSHFAIGDPWTQGGACYAHPVLLQTCHPKIDQGTSTVTFTRVRAPRHSH
jgi:hypothetical protein